MNVLFIKRIISASFFAFVIVNRLVAQDFELSPAKLLFTAEPGENQSKTISVKKHGNKKQNILITPKNYVPTKK